MSSERTAEIRQAIKAALPDFKFSITNEHHSGIRIHVLAGPIQMLTTPETIAKGRESVNHFYIADHYQDSPEVKAVLLKIMEIANAGNEIESVDGDYGNIPSFYVHMSIGDWDKPYQLVAKRRPIAPVTINATEYKKLFSVEGKIATCRINKQKSGIELYFPSKPSSEVLTNLKANGFRWGKFNKCWYRADNSLSRQVASCYADIPTEEANQDAALVDAQEQAAIANGNY